MIFIKLNDLNVKKNMKLVGASTYYFGPGNDGYVNMLEDLKNGIDYMTIHSDEEFEDKLEQYQNNYSAVSADSLYCIGGCIQTRDCNYNLRVKTVMDSVAITELLDLSSPWVKIRTKDHVVIVPH